jgi:hypothetical protein
MGSHNTPPQRRIRKQQPKHRDRPPPLPPANLREIHLPEFVIPTVAKRNGGICSSLSPTENQKNISSGQKNGRFPLVESTSQTVTAPSIAPATSAFSLPASPHFTNRSDILNQAVKRSASGASREAGLARFGNLQVAPIREERPHEGSEFKPRLPCPITLFPPRSRQTGKTRPTRGESSQRPIGRRRAQSGTDGRK